ncbi:MAG TPA: hypothetical protein VHX13_09555 [Acidobacteriaceae bacterium]|jgi:hypothetical protein|nr:hypothetical protein [Acidobacteriaceae bacterium]
MPCLELKLPARAWPQPAARLRTLLEKPGAAVLRRNHIARASGYDDVLLASSVRVAAVLAVDLTHPPQADGAVEAAASAAPAPASNPDSDEADPLLAGFARGLEIWIVDGRHTVCVFADADEITGALAMFDAYLRLARFQPAFERLDQREVGLNFTFREGLALGVQGHPAEARPESAGFFDGVAAIPEMEDSREPRFVVRLPNEGVGYFHELLRSASAWLEENSYTHILGSK